MGFKTNDIIKTMPAMLDLAAAGQLDLASAADIASENVARVARKCNVESGEFKGRLTR